MAAAFFNSLCDSTKVRAVSAGTQPAEKVHPVVSETMKEIGIDLSNASPQKLTEALAKDAALLITMGCGENCPFIPGLEVQDWPLEDPKNKSAERVREIRSQIKEAVLSLLKEKQWTKV